MPIIADNFRKKAEKNKFRIKLLENLDLCRIIGSDHFISIDITIIREILVFYAKLWILFLNFLDILALNIIVHFNWFAKLY